jgi:16S rRNA (cytidine1402-2'-O)-methyltransferase
MSGTEQDGVLSPGVLYIVATPIGNLQDITLRALRVLEGVDLIAAEDTRRTGMLMKAYGLKKPLISCFAHNEEKQSERIVALLGEGKTIALVSDAGMPGISDPGARLVRQVVQAGIKLTVVPGPSAGIAALAASGMDAGAYAFGGFFPRTGKERLAWLERFGGFGGTVVLYESPRRLAATLRLLSESWGDRQCCVARELTKRYEEFVRGSLSEVAAGLDQAEQPKGEIVVVVGGGAGTKAPSLSPADTEALGRSMLASGMGKKEASRKLAMETGVPARECYAMLIDWEKILK